MNRAINAVVTNTRSFKPFDLSIHKLAQDLYMYVIRHTNGSYEAFDPSLLGQFCLV